MMCKCNRSLFFLKLLLLSWYMATSFVWPFIAVLARSYHLTVSETAILFTVSPITNIPFNMFSGVLADKLGNYRVIMLASQLLTVVSFSLLLVIPKAATTTTVSHTFSCSPTGTKLVHLGVCPGSCPVSDFNVTLGLCRIVSSDNTSSLIFHSYYGENSTFALSCSSDCDCNLAEDFQCDRDTECDVLSTEPLVTCETAGVDRGVVFACVFLLICLGSIFQAVGYQFCDAYVFGVLKTHGGNYGQQKLFGIVGKIIAPPLIGYIVDVTGDETFTSNVIGLAAVMVVSVASVFFFDVVPDKPQKYVFRNLGELLKRIDIDVFLVVLFFLGGAWGFWFIFTGLILTDMGASKSLIGLVWSCQAVLGVPTLYLSDALVRKIGYEVTIVICAFAYCGRFLFISYIQNPWWAILSEAIGECLCQHVFWTAVATYSNELGGEKLRVTMQAVTRQTHFYIGRSLGIFIGGVLFNYLGMRGAFRAMGCFTGAVGLVYLLLKVTWLSSIKNKSRKRSGPGTLDEAEPAMTKEEEIERHRSNSISIQNH